MEKKKTKRNVFKRLFYAMIAFGLLTGIIFPFFAEVVLHTDRALSPQFILLCLGAGLLVGLVNYLLFHLVISRELDHIIEGMQRINASIRSSLDTQISSHASCELKVTSNDRLGEVIRAFNSMGRTIDERQQRETNLRQLMSTLSDCVDLTFIGQVILNHIPAPPAWNYAALYVLIDDSYHCVAVKNITRDSIPDKLAPTLSFFSSGELLENNMVTLKAAGTCFSTLQLIDEGDIFSPSHITLVNLGGRGRAHALILTACHRYTAPTGENRQYCHAFCVHVEPYIRHALLHEAVERQATIDGLSKVLNRRAGMERLEEEYSAAIRHKLNLSLIMLDIDHFKTVNDEHGHQAGDMVIRELARRMKVNLRDEDIIFRYGGEEFLVLLPHVGLPGAALCAERIRNFVADKPFDINTEQLTITISLGVATWPGSGAKDPDHLNQLADKALYYAKENGRNQVAIHTGLEIIPFGQLDQKEG